MAPSKNLRTEQRPNCKRRLLLTKLVGTHFLLYRVDPGRFRGRLWTPQLLIAAKGRANSKAVTRAAPWPTTSSTASAPRPSVSDPSFSFSSSSGSAIAPCFSAALSLAGVMSVARTVSNMVKAEEMAHSPT